MSLHRLVGGDGLHKMLLSAIAKTTSGMLSILENRYHTQGE